MTDRRSRRLLGLAPEDEFLPWDPPPSPVSVPQAFAPPAAVQASPGAIADHAFIHPPSNHHSRIDFDVRSDDSHHSVSRQSGNSAHRPDELAELEEVERRLFELERQELARRRDALRSRLRLPAAVAPPPPSITSQVVDALPRVPSLHPPVVPPPRAQDRVHEWLESQHSPPVLSNSPVGNLRGEENRSEELQIMKSMLARQSVPKDLAPFDGDPKMFPMFIAQYNGSTR